MSAYRGLVVKALEGLGLSPAEFPPEQIEGWMRLELGTLDAVGPARFREEVKMAARCVAADPKASARLAESYGLRPEAVFFRIRRASKTPGDWGAGDLSLAEAEATFALDQAALRWLRAPHFEVESRTFGGTEVCAIPGAVRS